MLFTLWHATWAILTMSACYYASPPWMSWLFSGPMMYVGLTASAVGPGVPWPLFMRWCRFFIFRVCGMSVAIRLVGKTIVLDPYTWMAQTESVHSDSKDAESPRHEHRETAYRATNIPRSSQARIAALQTRYDKRAKAGKTPKDKSVPGPTPKTKTKTKAAKLPKLPATPVGRLYVVHPHTEFGMASLIGFLCNPLFWSNPDAPLNNPRLVVHPLLMRWTPVFSVMAGWMGCLPNECDHIVKALRASQDVVLPIGGIREDMQEGSPGVILSRVTWIKIVEVTGCQVVPVWLEGAGGLWSRPLGPPNRWLQRLVYKRFGWPWPSLFLGRFPFFWLPHKARVTVCLGIPLHMSRRQVEWVDGREVSAPVHLFYTTYLRIQCMAGPLVRLLPPSPSSWKSGVQRWVIPQHPLDEPATVQEENTPRT